MGRGPPTPSAKSGVFFAPVGRKKLIKLSPPNGNIAKRKNPDRQMYLPESGFAFCSDFLHVAWKQGKKMAERAGFEPAVRFPVRQFSKLLLSATQPPLRVAAVLKLLLHNLVSFFTYLEARRMPSSVVRER